LAFCPKCGKEIAPTDTFCPHCGASLGVQGTPGTTGTTAAMGRTGFEILTKDSKAQGYWIERIVAYVIDSIIIYVIAGILAFLIFLPFFFAGGFGFYSFFYLAGFGIFGVFTGLLYLLYFTFFDAMRGGTVGKSLFHLKVTTSNGQHPNIGQAFVRNLSKIYWLLLLLDVIVGLATDNDYKRKFSDKYIGTIVVKA
jgi:uncharacterized RDD family membrane protein YckC